MRLGHRSCLALAVALGLSAWAHADSAPPVDFARDIQPLFQAHCYKCHDVRKQTAGFRLDVRDRALRGGESGKTAIIPGDSGKSELIRRVGDPDAEKGMPPGKEKLPAAQVQLLRAWIDAGAPWPDALANNTARGHWAFQPPRRPPVPAVKNGSWPRTDIDRFILARLDKEGLAPSPEAERVTLLRRLSLDLIGLPPTTGEVDAFLADTSDKAYDKVVDRLLSSPHYGERWARPWLDAARYADSDGFEKDKSRQVWFYRDWVISALNRDLPYDQFIIEQIAGDLLPSATQDQIVATGYLRNSMINEEGGVDPEQFRMEAMFDRMDAIGKGILGLTIQCAQCHSHKFDPLAQTEYYRMFAFLNNCYEANAAVYTPEEQLKRAQLFLKIRGVEEELQHRHANWEERMAAWETQAKSNLPAWEVVRPVVDEISDGGQKYLPQPDGSFLCLGYAPTKSRVKMTVRTDMTPITAFRLELMTDPNLPLTGPGRSIKGTGALTEFEVEAAPADEPGKVEKIKFVKATADFNPPETPLEAIYDDKSGKKRVTGPVAFAIDGKDETAWGTDAGPGRRNQPHQAVFIPEKPIAHPHGTVLVFHLKQNHGGWNSDDNQNHNLGRFRLAITRQPGAEADPVPPRVREILAIPHDQRSPSQTAAVFSYWRTAVPEWKEENDKIEALWHEHPEGSSQLVLEDRDTPRTTHVLKRGDFLKPGDAVTPGVPSFLHPLPDNTPLTRLTFARWLVDRRSPTTARAIVNRVWQNYFGTGLVSTPEDFGTQGAAPSHPELLDWLAVELMDSGWSLKALHRLIVSSAVYRQSSRVTPELLSRDPANRLLARGPRLRVDAEIVRDVSLAASGLLNDKVGGPSAFPPLPKFMVQPPVSYGPKVWNDATGPERYRRALYTFRYRSVPYPALEAFDAPNGDAACVRRSRSNTPLQALTGLNEPVFVECAQALGLRTLQDGGKTDNERVVYAFRRCLTRTPTATETAELLSLVQKQRQRFTQPGAKPLDLAVADPAKPPKLPEGTTAADLAAWTVVARVLLNLDETITKE
jgi:mono/diheme cytochrome c family protein